MKVNPVLEKLGFANDDRVLILHADDLGMAQASLAAYREMVEVGPVSAASVMAPCAWFPQVAAYCRQHPEADVGVHATLNSEWDNYRWRPLSTVDPATGLIDAEGFFHRRMEETQALADPAAVGRELQAQVEVALAAGIDVTHVDTHIGTVAHPKFIPAYVQLAFQYKVPVMVVRLDEAGFRARGMSAETAAFAALVVQQLEEQGLPLFDHLVQFPLDNPANRLERAIQTLEELPAGLTHFIIHPAHDTPELRDLAATWPSRVADYHTFQSDELRRVLRRLGIQVIGYRPLRELLRSG